MLKLNLTATLLVLIDEEMETEMVIDEEEKDEEEDFKNIPLFGNSDEHVEPFHLDESSHIPQPHHHHLMGRVLLHN